MAAICVRGPVRQASFWGGSGGSERLRLSDVTVRSCSRCALRRDGGLGNVREDEPSLKTVTEDAMFSQETLPFPSQYFTNKN